MGRDLDTAITAALTRRPRRLRRHGQGLPGKASARQFLGALCPVDHPSHRGLG